jgi:hypothetical protein
MLSWCVTLTLQPACIVHSRFPGDLQRLPVFSTLHHAPHSPAPLSLFQQLSYPMRKVHPERSESSLCLTDFQQLTNCLRFDTLSEPLSFQQLPTVKFCNSFLLITIRNARGGYRGRPRRTSSLTLTPLPLCPTSSSRRSWRDAAACGNPRDAGHRPLSQKMWRPDESRLGCSAWTPFSEG